MIKYLSDNSKAKQLTPLNHSILISIVGRYSDVPVPASRETIKYFAMTEIKRCLIKAQKDNKGTLLLREAALEIYNKLFSI